jgi:hypothetical protein
MIIGDGNPFVFTMIENLTCAALRSGPRWEVYSMMLVHLHSQPIHVYNTMQLRVERYVAVI